MMTRKIQPLVRFAALMLTAGGFLAAQPASDLLEKAPPHIDKLLRERVRFFYQAHVDGKFRLADQKRAGRWTILFFYPADFTFV